MNEKKVSRGSRLLAVLFMAVVVSLVGLMVGYVLNNVIIARISSVVVSISIVVLVLRAELDGYINARLIKNGKKEVTPKMMKMFEKKKTVSVLKSFKISTCVGILIVVLSGSGLAYVKVAMTPKLDKEAVKFNTELCSVALEEFTDINKDAIRILSAASSYNVAVPRTLALGAIQLSTEISRAFSLYNTVISYTLEKNNISEETFKAEDVSEDVLNTKIAIPQDVLDNKEETLKGCSKMSQLMGYGNEDLDTAIAVFKRTGMVCDLIIKTALNDDSTLGDLQLAAREIQDVDYDGLQEKLETVLNNVAKTVKYTAVLTILLVISGLYLLGHVGERRQFLIASKLYVEPVIDIDTAVVNEDSTER